ncbi:MAG: peptidoglycan-binding protein [Candidatus Omnitrophica bacterium]|nr:peptidoglycan-binding protein [Candidatus Omnitrophota bacterium]
MQFRIVLCLLLALGIAGCATPKKKGTQVDELNGKVSQMESQLQEKDMQLASKDKELSMKDEEISNLEDELKGCTGGAKGHRSYSSKGSGEKANGKDVQQALKNAGYYDGPVDGKIGKGTRKAIKAFQKASGLTADGVVGKKTWSKLRTHL